MNKLKVSLFFAGLVVCLFATTFRQSPRAEFLPFQTAIADSNKSPGPPFIIHSELLAGTPAAHSATLVRLDNGEVLAFWFAGSREGARDVRIFSSRLKGDNWTSPEPILSVQQAMTDELRLVRKLGNPVAVLDASGRLHLFFVSVSMGGWATSNLNQMTSEDGGLTWNRSHVLVTSPFLNMSTLARTPAIQRSDGGFDLPIYHEGARKFAELLRFDSRGKNFQKKRLTTSGAYLQPAIVAVDRQRAFALLRDAGPDRRLQGIQSNDGGNTWSGLQMTDQLNPDSAVALARFSDGTFLLAYNPRGDGRSELALATSNNGVEWVRRKVVEYESGGEFSYPTLLIASDQEVHLVYTWQRRLIRHIRFNRGWLAEPSAGKTE